MASDSDLPSWLPSLSIRHANGQYILNDGTICPFTFEQITNAIHRPRLPRRVPEVRRALALTLRSAHHPGYQDKEPWVAAEPRYQPFRSTIQPLLAHPHWSTARLLAAPFLTYIPRSLIAGPIDVILQLPDGSIAIAILQTARRHESLLYAVRTELGGALAAVIDHRTIAPDHALTIWAAPGSTEIEYHHPDMCLGTWVDAASLHRHLQKVRAEGPEQPSV